MRFERAATIALVALLAGMAPLAASASDLKRVYLTVDKSQAMAFPSAPVSRISVTNPMIADVYVTSPTQILISGKTPGRTSMIVVQGNELGYYDVVVHPAPVIVPKADLVPADEHGIEVLRAGRSSHQLFVRDTDRAWVPLGTPKGEPEPAQK